MNSKNNKLVVVCLFLVQIVSFSQISAQSKIDSLEQLITLQNGKEKIKTQLDLTNEYIWRNSKTADSLLKEINKELANNKDTENYIIYYYYKSFVSIISENFKEAKKEADSALFYAEKFKDSIKYKSKIYLVLSIISDNESKIKEAIEYQLIALRYAESINYYSQIATICNGLGKSYEYLSDYKTAKKYLFRAIDIKERRNEYDNHLSRIYTNLSNCLDAEGDYKESLAYLEKAIVLKKKYHSLLDLSVAYNNKAYTLFLMKDYPKAEQAVVNSIRYSDSISSEADKMYAYTTYAEILFETNQINKAKEYLNKSIILTKKNNDLYLVKYNLDLLYNIYIKEGDYKKAVAYLEEKNIVMNSIYNVKNRTAIKKLELDYETEKKNKEIELLNKEKEINNLKLKKSEQLQLAFLVLAVLAITVLILLWSRHKNKINTAKLFKESLQRDFDKKLAILELQTLRAQMNPHFLFNSLNSINSFIIKNEQELASEYLSKFSKLIRCVLNNSKLPKVMLSNELEALQLYVEMESLRFSNKFEYTINVAPEIDEDYTEIPPLIIQPYVENSIWHGLMNKKDGIGKLVIEIKKENNLLICTIEDNGIGREAAKHFKSKGAEKIKSYGMDITEERLSFINNDADNHSNLIIVDLKDESGKGIGTRVQLKIKTQC